MESFNKLISLFLGLVIVIIVFGIITGRIDFNNRLPFLGKKQEKITPTPDKKDQNVKIKVSSETSTQYNLYQKPTLTIAQKYVSSIPQTGVPTVFIPLTICGLLGGFYIRKKTS